MSRRASTPRRLCDWCHTELGPAYRKDAKTCSKRCRQAKHRFRVGVASPSSETRRMRLAYADPPYPGLARKYYGPDAQEVNHALLVGTLEDLYPDGWALSTSAAALPRVLALCPPDARVCAWVRGARRSVAYRARSAWEPLIVVGGRLRHIEPAEGLDDVLVWGGRHRSHPDALIGMKPAAFAEWMFRQLGAEGGDSLDDIFPGSGSVTRAWDLYTSSGTDATGSRLAEAQSRLVEQLDG